MNYFLFLDYDGTLTPIAKKPSLARLSKSKRKVLKKASQAKDLTLAIISGRKLSNLKNMVGLAKIYYAGNHGFEIEGPQGKIIHPKARAAVPIIKKIKNKLKKSLKGIAGALVEDKTLTLSLHYRLVKNKDLKRVEDIFKAAIAPYLKTRKIRLTHGKKVFEVRPKINWHKGKAVLWLLKNISPGKKTLPIYIGDDTTDEDAFKAINRMGITLRVGKSTKSSAQFFLRSVESVYNYIESLT